MPGWGADLNHLVFANLLDFVFANFLDLVFPNLQDLVFQNPDFEFGYYLLKCLLHQRMSKILKKGLLSQSELFIHKKMPIVFIFNKLTLFLYSLSIFRSLFHFNDLLSTCKLYLFTVNIAST